MSAFSQALFSHPSMGSPAAAGLAPGKLRVMIYSTVASFKYAENNLVKLIIRFIVCKSGYLLLLLLILSKSSGT